MNDEYYILRDRGSRKGNLSLLVLASEITRRSSTNGQSEMPNRNIAMIMGQGEHVSGCNNLQKAIPTRREGGEEIRSELTVRGEGGEGGARGRCVANGFTNVVSPKVNDCGAEPEKEGGGRETISHQRKDFSREIIPGPEREIAE